MSFGNGSIPKYLEQIRKNKERTKARGYHERMDTQGMVKSKEVPTYARFSEKEKEAFDQKIQKNKREDSKRLLKSILLSLLTALAVIWIIQRIILWAFF